MKEPRWLAFISVLLALFTRDLASWLAGFEYKVFSEPFNLAKFAVEFGSLVVLVYVYVTILGMLLKWRDGKAAAGRASGPSK